MKLGMKIGAGFSLLIIIAMALGAMASYNMYTAAKESTKMAHEYVPEVDVALELRGATNRIMYEMRGFGLSEDKKFYEDAQKEFRAMDAILEKARKLADEARHLKKLKGQLDQIESVHHKYEKASVETLGITEKLSENRVALDENAAKYADNAAQFLAGQNEKFKTDLSERQKKVQLVTSIVGLVSQARVTNFKAQATGDAALMQKALDLLGGIAKFTGELRPITKGKEFTEIIDQLEDAGQAYAKSMESYLAVGNEMAQDQKEMDRAAGAYMEETSTLLTEQNGKLRSEMEFQGGDLSARFKSINLLTEIKDLGNKARVANFKAQAAQDPDLMKEAVSALGKAKDTLGELRKVTHNDQELQRINTIETSAQSYLESINGYLGNLTGLGTIRNDMDRAAGSVTALCDDFLAGQQAKLAQDLGGRMSKINLATALVDLSSDTMIKTFKSQALRSPVLIEQANKNFGQIETKVKELKAITVLDEDLKRIDGIQGAADGYGKAVDLFLTNWLALQELAKTREAAGDEMIGAAKITSDAGMAQTREIAASAEASLLTSTQVMIAGLIVALIVGALLAFFITRSITKPVNRMIDGLNTGSDQVAAASTQVSSSSQSLAEGASEQAAALEETSSSMEETNVSTVDNGQLWISRQRLERMTALPGQATLVVVGREVKELPRPQGWVFQSPARLMKDLTDMVNSKRVTSSFMYAILMLLALLAVFDTQILSIFRRRKEIGTIMALGMVRSRVVALFTLEGAMHGLLALVAAAAWGIPVLIWSARKGIPLPGLTEDYGYALAARLFPVYSLGLVGGTVLVVMVTVIIVSYLPSRRISGWKVTEALKGKIS